MLEKPVEVVADGILPESLSPSRAKDFVNCQLQWWFTVAHGWRTPPNRHTVLGVAVHGAFEQLYKSEPEERTQHHALALLEQSWAEQKADERNAVVTDDTELVAELEDESRNSVLGLWQLERPHHVEVAHDANEQRVEAFFGEAKVAGVIDRYTDNGVYRISDYKTGKVPQPAYTESYLFGMWTYAAVMMARHPEKRPVDEVELLYVSHGIRIRRPVLVEYARNHALRLRNIWRDQRAVTDNHVVLARRSPLCKWCAFAPVCPMLKGSNAPAPGSAESDAQLLQLGLTRRSAPTTEPELEEILDETPDIETTDVEIEEEESW